MQPPVGLQKLLLLRHFLFGGLGGIVTRFEDVLIVASAPSSLLVLLQLALNLERVFDAIRKNHHAGVEH